MAEVCRDIDQGLAALNSKINALNNELRQIKQKQKECCDQNKGNDRNPRDNPVDLREIIRRLEKLEKTQEALKIGVVESLNNFADIENTSQELMKAFGGIYEMVTPLIDVVSTIIGFLGEESDG